MSIINFSLFITFKNTAAFLNSNSTVSVNIHKYTPVHINLFLRITDTITSPKYWPFLLSRCLYIHKYTPVHINLFLRITDTITSPNCWPLLLSRCLYIHKYTPVHINLFLRITDTITSPNYWPFLLSRCLYTNVWFFYACAAVCRSKRFYTMILHPRNPFPLQ